MPVTITVAANGARDPGRGFDRRNRGNNAIAGVLDRGHIADTLAERVYQSKVTGNDIVNEAAVRLTAYLYDRPNAPRDSGYANALAQLRRWRGAPALSASTMPGR